MTTMIQPHSRAGQLLRRIGDTRFGRRVLGPRMLTRADALLHRLTGGRFHAGDLLFDTLVLTTTGRRSGQPRASTLACWDVGDGTLSVIASNFGREHHPAWSLNLLANPEATIEHHGRRRRVRARQLEGAERAAVWHQAVRTWPGYRTYADLTEEVRDIRVFALDPVE